MQMAQFINSDSEEPAALIQRLRFSSSYPVAVQQSCGMPKDGELGEYLGKALEVRAIKNVASVVELKFCAPSTTQARQCAEAITAMIVAQQRSLIEERLAGRQEQLLQYQQALREEQQQMEMIRKSELANFGYLGYLAKLDKLSWLRLRIDALREEALLSQKHPAKLTFPVIVPSKPVSPKAGLALLLGVSLGFMLGVLYALGRDWWLRES